MKIFQPKYVFPLISLFLIFLVISWFIEQSILAQESLSLSVFAGVHFLGYLFFLLLPVEAFYIVMLLDGASPLQLLIIALITGTVAQFLDYAAGRLLPERTITYLIGEKRHTKGKRLLHKYGYLAVLFLTLSPFSSPLIVLIAGLMRLKFRYVFIYTLIGLLVKYLALNLFFGWF